MATRRKTSAAGRVRCCTKARSRSTARSRWHKPIRRSCGPARNPRRSHSTPCRVGAIACCRVRPTPRISRPRSAPGGKWFVAQGWWLTGVQAADSKNYELRLHDNTREVPPTSIAVQIGGIVAGDYVFAARDDGAGGYLQAEYSVSPSGGATSVSVGGLKADTPASGAIPHRRRPLHIFELVWDDIEWHFSRHQGGWATQAQLRSSRLSTAFLRARRLHRPRCNTNQTSVRYRVRNGMIAHHPV